MKKTIIFAMVMILSFTLFATAEKSREEKIKDCQPLLKESQELFQQNKVDEAIAKMKEAIKIVPDYHNFYSILSYLYTQKKDYENQYLTAKKTVELYEAAKKRGEKKNMTDVFYMNLGAAAVNYSYALRQKKEYKKEVELLQAGLKSFKKFMELNKKGKFFNTAKEQADTIEKDLLPVAKKAAAAKK